MAERKSRVLVAGAGIGGLTAALCLLRHGFDVEVYEQAPELKEVGAGLWLSTNGVRVLHELGLEAPLRAATLECTERVIRHWNTGQTWWLYKKEGASTVNAPYVLLRAHLLRILQDGVEALKPGAVRLGKRCSAFTQDAKGVRMTFADGTTAEGDLLVGADGHRSQVREGLMGPVNARFTNAVAWRGLVPMDRLSPHQRTPRVSTWVGPTAHMTIYPVKWRDVDLLTFSGQVESTAWTLESWNENASAEQCLAEFTGWHPDILEMITAVEQLHKWGLFVREALPFWSKGRVTLLGDACHAMVPYLGQGVNMAVEDSAILARCLAQDASSPEAALQRYERVRRGRTAQVQLGSADMQYTFHHPDLESINTAVPYIEKHWSPAASKARFDWIYQYDALRAPLEAQA